MCGIAGIIDFSFQPPSQAVLHEMTDTLAHRGPDASGLLIDGPCGLGHRRLSIIDIAGSSQPMRIRQDDLSLTYNGELYNFVTLRDQLKSEGVEFESSGDTEVLLRCLDRHWVDALPRLDGMFAFGVWDRTRRRLLLARDPLGEKPLFYTMPRPDLLVFASEIKSLLVHPEVKAELDRDGLRQVLRFRAVYGEGSLYSGVRQVEPGAWVEFDATGLTQGRFFDLYTAAELAREQMRSFSPDQTVRFGEWLLEDSVRERMVADVPVGAFLSGGLDSSLIVAMIQRARKQGDKLRTFSVGFSDDDNSELPFARAVATALDTDHTEVHLQESDYHATFAELTARRDAPLSEPADLAIAKMSTVARQSVKVVLSGEGADEAFCGYPKYRLARVSWPARAMLRLVGAERVAYLAKCAGLDQRRALVAARSLAMPTEVERLVSWFSYLGRGRLQTLFPGLEWSDGHWEKTMTDQADILRRDWVNPIARMQAVDCLTWLPGNLLQRGDRMTMATGLELRVPFLDKELVAFGLALDPSMKVRRGSLKHIARRWAAPYIPQSILSRRKWGFRVPLAAWFRAGMRPMLFDYLTSRHGLCSTYGDRSAINTLLESHDSGKIDANLELWTLLATEVWYQDVFLPAQARSFRESVDGLSATGNVARLTTTR